MQFNSGLNYLNGYILLTQVAFLWHLLLEYDAHSSTSSAQVSLVKPSKQNPQNCAQTSFKKNLLRTCHPRRSHCQSRREFHSDNGICSHSQVPRIRDRKLQMKNKNTCCVALICCLHYLKVIKSSFNVFF